MKPVRNLIALVALGAVIAGCETSSVTSFFDDDEPAAASSPPASVGAVPNTAVAPVPGYLAETGRYPPQARYYELTLDGFPASTRCEVKNARGEVSKRGTGRRIVIYLTGYPSVADVTCDIGRGVYMGGGLFVIDTNKWAFTQPRRAGINPGDVEKVYVSIVYSLTDAKLSPIAEMTMHTASGKFTDRVVIDTVKRQPTTSGGTQQPYQQPYLPN